MNKRQKPNLIGVPECCKCGKRLFGSKSCCCSHTCRALCVKFNLEDCPFYTDCDCTEPNEIYVLYDDQTESYSGNISCGSTAVDFSIQVRKDELLGCVACLTSSCLNLYNESCIEAVTGTASCIGSRDEDEATLSGGMEFKWVVTVEDCGDYDCDVNYVLEAKCVDRIFPEEATSSDYECGCTNCFCLCRELCINWVYDDAIDLCDKQRKAEFEPSLPGWTFEFEPDSVNGEGEECRININIVLQKNETTGFCELAIKRKPDTVDETTTLLGLGDCPFVSVENLQIAEFETISIKCDDCTLCGDPVCKCLCDLNNPSGAFFVPPETLTLDYNFDYVGADGNDAVGTIQLIQDKRKGCEWSGQVVQYCEDPNTLVRRLESWGFNLFLSQGNTAPLCGWNLTIEQAVTVNPPDPGLPLLNCDTMPNLLTVSEWPGPNSCNCPVVDLTFFRSERGGSLEFDFTMEITE